MTPHAVASGAAPSGIDRVLHLVGREAAAFLVQLEADLLDCRAGLVAAAAGLSDAGRLRADCHRLLGIAATVGDRVLTAWAGRLHDAAGTGRDDPAAAAGALAALDALVAAARDRRRLPP
jgi:hypothetical protein